MTLIAIRLSARGEVLRRTRVSVLVVLVACVAAATSAAAAPEQPDTRLTIEGTIVRVAVEREFALATTDVEQTTAAEPYLEVDGSIYPLIASQSLGVGSTGRVVVTLDADPSLGVADTLTEATDSVSPSAARIVEIAPIFGAPARRTALDLASGNHSLVVLPVYWASPDDATATTLLRSATGAAEYWERQSGGRVDVQPVVRDWRPINSPGACDVTRIMNSALAAHNEAPPSATRHVLVYFPDTLGCPFAGRASIGSGYIWINGADSVYVMAHEWGHNFGLGHANTADCASGGVRVPLASDCTVQEYGDNADVMGQGRGPIPGNLNTAFADHLGYVNATSFATGPASPATVEIAPLANVLAMRSVRIPTAWGSVFADFRPGVAPDTHEPGWAGVQVHLLVEDDYGVPTAYLLDMQPGGVPFRSPALAAGKAWNVPGVDIQLAVKALGSSAQVSVGRTGAVQTGPSASGASAPCSKPGSTGQLPVVSPAVFRGGAFFLRGSYTTGGADVCMNFGNPGDAAVMGDWDGNGTKTPGVFRNGTWYLRNANSQGGADIVVQFGSDGDVPLVGDWNSDGIESVGVFRNGTWYLRNTNTSGPGDGSFTFGQSGDQPVVGDWNNDGTDTLGVFRGGYWYLSNFFDHGAADAVFPFGSPGDQPVIGDWNRDGTDTLGVYRNGTWYISNYFDRGTAEGTFGFGAAGDKVALFR